jgi:O-antigen/teichoic acid export membrane protein
MSESRWKTLLHAYWLNLGSKLAEIAYFLLLVSLLDKSELGLFNTLMSLTLFFLTLLDFGLSQATLREISQQTLDVRALVRQGTPLRALVTLIVLGMLAAAHAAGVATLLQTQVLMLLALFQLFNALQSTMLAGLQGSGLQTRANQLASAEAIVKLAALALLQWRMSPIDLLTVVTSLLVIKFVFGMITWRMLPTSVPDIPTHSAFSLRQLNGQTGFLLIALFTILQNRLDWLMVSAFMDSASVASYSVVNRYYEIALFVLGIGFTTIYPWLCRVASTRHNDRALQLLRQLQFLPVPLLVAAGIVAFPLINVMFWHGRYGDAIAAVDLLLPCAGLAVGNMMIYYDLMAQRHEKKLLYICVVSTVLQALFNAWAIPRFGINGAIAGMWLMNFANLLLFAFAAQRHISSRRDVFFTVSVAVAISGALLLAVNLLPAVLLLLLIMLATLATALVVWLGKARELALRAEGAP